MTRFRRRSDARDFLPILHHARRRYGIHSYIKVGAGRPTRKKLTSQYRRQMQRQLAGGQSGKPFGQRAQVETVNSMMKRNLGDHLRSRQQDHREDEMLLRAAVHNVMILRRDKEGSEQIPYDPVSVPEIHR